MKTKITKIISKPMHEIELHYKRPLMDGMTKITNAEEAHNCFKQYINPNRIDLKEFFWVIFLTNANQVLGIAEIGSGTDKGVRVNVKEIFQLALTSNSSAIIVAHNHPSGKLIISSSDKEMTERIKKICILFSITLIDHLIITSESFSSFQEEGLL